MISFNFILRFINNTFVPRYKIIVVDSNSEFINEVYKYRYHLYVEVDKLLNKEDYKESKESDIYDSNSTFFVAIDSKKNILGMARIINVNTAALPTVEEFKLEEELKKNNLLDKKVVEISRFMISPEYRKTFLLLNLMKALYIYSRENNIDFWLGCVEDWFLNTLKKTGANLVVLGKPIYCFNAMNYPFVVDLRNLEGDLLKNNKFVYYFFKKKSNNFYFKNV